jgi:tetratricopeptide (TPR) repeat protein|nr:tetratricopeptide repeat protein [uncultured Undibacterium sp.]
MRSITSSFLFLGLLSLCACTTPTPTPKLTIQADQVAWHDQYFKDESDIPVISKEEVFGLSKGLLQQLGQPQIQSLSNYARTKYFRDLIFTKEISNFRYTYEESTVAAKTWENKSGNCISLTLLAYSVGRALNLPIVMQEVDVPVLFDRRGNVEFLNLHVNAMVLHKDSWIAGEEELRGYLVIDFEPQTMNLNPGRILNEDEILSRFYNNMAAEFIAKNQAKKAYAYFKAAILADPNNSHAYNNLAQLYLQFNAISHAELVLKQALQLNEEDAVVLRSLHKLFLSQNRTSEAEKLVAAIEVSNAKNPHYWIGLGIYAMQNKDYKTAIKRFEKAQTLASGFAEIHQNLAEAYMKIGDMNAAKAEIIKLVSLVPSHPKSALLRTKFASR